MEGGGSESSHATQGIYIFLKEKLDLIVYHAKRRSPLNNHGDNNDDELVGDAFNLRQAETRYVVSRELGDGITVNLVFGVRTGQIISVVVVSSSAVSMHRLLHPPPLYASCGSCSFLVLPAPSPLSQSSSPFSFSCANEEVTVTVSSVIIDKGMVCTAGCQTERDWYLSFDRPRPTDLFSLDQQIHPRPKRRHTGNLLLFVVRYNAESAASHPPPQRCTPETHLFRGLLTVCVGDLSLLGYITRTSEVQKIYSRCSLRTSFRVRVLIIVTWHCLLPTHASFVTRPVGRDQCE